LDLFAVGRLDFEPPDLERFPCLRVAFDAIAAGGTAPTILNAANEVAVAHFLAGRLGFTEIAGLVEQTLEGHEVVPVDDLEQLLDVDRSARRYAEQLLKSRVG
jgi:1-deoxy-D-xylulose-5-phosphate reductoisomerase